MFQKDDTRRGSKTNQPQAAVGTSDKNELTAFSSHNAQNNGNHLTSSAKHTNSAEVTCGEIITPSQIQLTTSTERLSNNNGVTRNCSSAQLVLTTDQKEQTFVASEPQVDTNMTISSLHDKLKLDRPQNYNNPLQPQQTQRQVKFEPYCDSEKNNMIHSDKENDGEDLTPSWQQIDEFLRRNPIFLTKHVLDNVPSDEIQSWLDKKTPADDKSCKGKEQVDQVISFNKIKGLMGKIIWKVKNTSVVHL